MRERSPGRPGFTLVELLTVIAIIAILAAIIFPVMSTVRRNVWKTQCTSNLHSIQQAVKMYKDDWRVYPDALLGYKFQDPTLGGRENEQDFLYPQYIKELQQFRCPLAPEKSDNPTVTTTQLITGKPALHPIYKVPVAYYLWDSYDGTRVPHPNGPYQRHYARKWSVTPNDRPNFGDDPRQMIYRNPPDNTVITWCTYHRFYSNGQPEQGSIDLVLFLDGHVKPTPSNVMLPTGDDPFRPYHALPTP